MITVVKVLSAWGFWLFYLFRSDIIWEEQKKKGRWKALKVGLSDELETAWTKVQQDLSVGATQSYIYKSAELEVIYPTRKTKFDHISKHCRRGELKIRRAAEDF